MAFFGYQALRPTNITSRTNSAEAISDAERGFFGAKPYLHTASFPEKARSKRKAHPQGVRFLIFCSLRLKRSAFAAAILDAECGFFGAKPYLHTASFPEKVRYAPKVPCKISP